MRLLDRLEQPTFWLPMACYWNSTDPYATRGEGQSLSFMNTLQNAFSSQFATQQNTLNFLNTKLTNMVNNPQGYSAPALAAMRTSATDQVAQQFQSAKRANQNTEFNRGAENMPSGVNAQINAGLDTEAAQTEAGAQNQITQANANLQQQNFWNATNALNGVASQYNPLGYAGDANGAGSTLSSLSGAETSAEGGGLGMVLGGVAGGIAGKLIAHG